MCLLCVGRWQVLQEHHEVPKGSSKTSLEREKVLEDVGS